MALAKQLKGLQSIKEQDYPSILFSKQVSQSYDIDAIYYIGLKGIKKLIQIDQNFSLYSQSLFSTDKKGINRQVLNQLDNDSLNVQLRACLKLLSKYFGFEGSHQVIEYLLRNYHINQHLPNECIIYFLQYHNTTIYTRLLQNIVEEQRENMWGFLYEPISRAQTISRDLIVRQMQLDYRILKQLLDYGSEQLIPLEEPQDIIYDTNAELTQDDIIRIKQKQPSLLSFVFTILNQLNVNAKYYDQIRSTLGKLIAQCFQLNTQESKSFVYLIYQQQLFNPEKLWLTQSQISNTATHVYGQNNQLELILLFYQFGINTNEATSRQLLSQDIQELSQNPLLFMEVMKPLKNINLEAIFIQEPYLKRNKLKNLYDFATKGQYLYSASRDGQIRAWDLVNREIASKFLISRYEESTTVNEEEDQPKQQTIKQNIITAATFSERSVYSGYEDGLICSKNIKSGEMLYTFLGHKQSITALHFLNVRQLVSASLDGTIRLWDTSTGICEIIFNIGFPINKMNVLPEKEIQLLYTKNTIVQQDLQKQIKLRKI